jgi:hypothetical protein
MATSLQAARKISDGSDPAMIQIKKPQRAVWIAAGRQIDCPDAESAVCSGHARPSQ